MDEEKKTVVNPKTEKKNGPESDDWATEALQEMDDFIESQGIYIRQQDSKAFPYEDKRKSYMAKRGRGPLFFHTVNGYISFVFLLRNKFVTKSL